MVDEQNNPLFVMWKTIMKVEKRPHRECAKERSPSIFSECVGLRETYFNCKRGQVDMRARIRGNKGY